MKYLFLFLLLPVLAHSQTIVNRTHFSSAQKEQGTQWVSYRLTREMVQGDTLKIRRPSLKRYENQRESDYRNTGYDRSHLAAAKTFSFDSTAYYEVFDMINIVPQTPKVNRSVWRYIEEYERCLAIEHGCLYVVIRVYYGDKKKGNLAIPSYFIREIYTCDLKVVGSYRVENLFRE